MIFYTKLNRDIIIRQMRNIAILNVYDTVTNTFKGSANTYS